MKCAYVPSLTALLKDATTPLVRLYCVLAIRVMSDRRTLNMKTYAAVLQQLLPVPKYPYVPSVVAEVMACCPRVPDNVSVVSKDIVERVTFAIRPTFAQHPPVQQPEMAK